MDDPSLRSGLRTKPSALTSLQRQLLGWTTVVVGLTRVWARSLTLWDWDETLFALAIRDYDVVQHHPHPPGFPFYIALAKVIRVVANSDFHALQGIATVASIAVFPLLFWLAYELRFPFSTALLGSLLFSFFPNVWFFGGTAFSDIPGLALVIAACAALVRGCRSTRSYYAGAILLGLAAAIRPQALIIGCAPALVASFFRLREKRWKDVALAAAIGVAILVGGYGGAALASQSVEGYFATARALRDYVREVDSYLNPQRAPVAQLFPDFFLRAIPGGKVTTAIAILAAVSILISFFRRTWGVWLLVAMFLPFNVMGLFLLDTNSISRYSIGYAPMYAVLAADGIAALFVVWRTAPSFVVGLTQVVVVIAAIARLMWWTIPAIRDVRRTVSPPVAAMQWLREHVPVPGPLFVHGSMGPFASYFVPDYKVVTIEDPSELPLQPFGAGDWFVTEGATAVRGGHNFVRERGHLFNIARQRYFEVSAVPLSSLVRFVSGWYGSESVGTSEWRWMSGHSETMLPPIAGNARLTLGFDLPTELVPRRPTIELRLNGQLVDRFICTTPSVAKSWVVPARSDAWNQLVISMDKVLNPAKEGVIPDPRDLGLNLTSYSWGPAGVP